MSIKNLMSLFCGLFVPKRVINGGDKLIYGVDASSLGCVGNVNSPIQTINLPDALNTEGTLTYVAPYDCVASLYVSSYCRHVAFAYRTRLFKLVRSTGNPESNLATSMRFSKGQEFSLRYSGTGVTLYIYTVLPN